MADFLGGLLSGGGGLYDDLLTPQQRDQLSSRGLLSMAGAFAEAAMPSRFPVPLGAALGKAAAAMSGGRDEAALRLLQGQKLSQEVQTMKATSALQQQFMKDIQTLPLDALFKRYNIGGAGGAPAAAGPSVMPGAAPAVPARPAAALTTAPLPPPAAALPGTPAASAALFGGDSAAGEYGVGQYDVGQGIPPPPTRAAALPLQDSPPTAAERLEWNQTVGTGGLDIPLDDWVAARRARVPAGGPSAQPPDAPPGAGSSLNDRYGGILAMAGGPGGASGSSLPPPDELIRQGSGPGGLLQASYTGAPPFGAGGDEVGSGASVPAGTRYNMPMLRNLAESVGFKGQDADTMAATWMGESGGNPFAKKVDAREASYGLAQINARAHPGGEQAYGDPDYAARKSYDLYQKSKARGGSGFGDWSIYNSGAYKQFLPGGGQAAGGGAPDEVIRSGGGVPGFTRAQYSGAAPGASGGAPTAAAGGDGQGMNTLLLELAKRNAMAEILKLGNPYSSMLSVLQGSPAYQGQIEAAKREAGIPFIAREKTEERSVTEPSDIRIAQAKTAAEMAKDMALQGFMLDPDTNKVVPVPGYWDMMKGREDDKQRLQAEWQAKFKPVDATVWLPDGSKGTQKMTEYEFQQRQAATAKRASMGAAPQPGDIAAMPAYDPQQLKGLDAQTKILEEKRGLASTARGQIQNFNDQRRQIEQGVIAGQFAEGRTGWAKIGQVLGLTGATEDQLIANTETYVANLGRNLKEGLAGLGPPISNSDVAIAERITGSQQMTVKGALQLMELREKYARLALKEYNDRVKATPNSGHQYIPEPPTHGARQFRDPRTGDVFWENKETGQWQSSTTGAPYGG